MVDAPLGAQPIRCMSVDVEEYFHIEAVRGEIGPANWHRWPRRVEASMDRLLALLHQLDRRATLFFLGDVARHQPRLVRRCAEAGHEIASHGTNHERLHRLTPDTFRDDLLESRKRLEDLTGQPVLGYRAPTWSVTWRTAWALDVLAEAGFAYDASVFPVRHPWYGIPHAPDRPFMVRSHPDAAALLELPPLTWRVGRRNIAVAGGGYFRLLPLALMRRGLEQAAGQGRPAILYFHPWEFDPDLPRLPLGALGRVRTYTGLGRALGRLERILRLPGTWRPIAEDLDTFRGAAQQRDVVTLHPGPVPVRGRAAVSSA